MIRSGLFAALILTAAVLLSGVDWSAPFKKTKNAIVTTGKKISGNNADSAAADLAEENDNFDFVIEMGGQRRAEGHREFREVTYQGMNCRETITMKLYKIKRNDTEFTSTVNQRMITGPHGEALFLQEVTDVGGKREKPGQCFICIADPRKEGAEHDRRLQACGLGLSEDLHSVRDG